MFKNSEFITIVMYFMLAVALLYPFAYLAVEVDKNANERKTPIGKRLLSIIPFVNYCSIRKDLYGSNKGFVITSIFAVLCAGYSMLVLFVFYDADKMIVLTGLIARWVFLLVWYIMGVITAMSMCNMFSIHGATKLFAILFTPAAAYLIAVKVTYYFKKYKEVLNGTFEANSQ